MPLVEDFFGCRTYRRRTRVQVDAEELERLQRALAQASDATDALDEKIDEQD